MFLRGIEKCNIGLKWVTEFTVTQHNRVVFAKYLAVSYWQLKVFAKSAVGNSLFVIL